MNICEGQLAWDGLLQGVISMTNNWSNMAEVTLAPKVDKIKKVKNRGCFSDSSVFIERACVSLFLPLSYVDVYKLTA